MDVRSLFDFIRKRINKTIKDASDAIPEEEMETNETDTEIEEKNDVSTGKKKLLRIQKYLMIIQRIWKNLKKMIKNQTMIKKKIRECLAFLEEIMILTMMMSLNHLMKNPLIYR